MMAPKPTRSGRGPEVRFRSGCTNPMISPADRMPGRGGWRWPFRLWSTFFGSIPLIPLLQCCEVFGTSSMSSIGPKCCRLEGLQRPDVRQESKARADGRAVHSHTFPSPARALGRHARALAAILTHAGDAESSVAGNGDGG